MPIIEWDLDYPKDMPWLIPMVEAEFKAALERAAEGQLTAIGRQFILDDAVASGKTAKSFDISEVVTFGDRMSIQIAPKGDRADVAYYLEVGTNPSDEQPSREMVDNITKWMKSRNIKPSAGTAAYRYRALAYVISKTILENGLDDRAIVEKAEKHYQPYITKIFEAAARRVANKINQNLTAR